MIEGLPDKRLFRPDEVAEHFRISRSTVYDLIRRKKIEVIRIGRLIRIPGRSVAKYLERTTRD